MLEVPGRVAEELAGALGDGSLGVEIREGPRGRSQLRVYTEHEANARRLCREVPRVLRAHGIDPSRSAARAQRLRDARWAERYQESLVPFRLGGKFVIEPRPGARASGRRIPIRLVPGRAFGTGEHPTTQLCAATLERRVRPGSTWLDLGTGSGILSVVALRCGAARVVALDTDPEAVAVAREVLRVNGLAARVRLATGSIEARDGETFDGIVANLDAPFFLDRGQELVGALVGGGILIASGFLGNVRREVGSAIERGGLVVVEVGRRGPWAAILLERPVAPPGTR